MFKPLQTHDRPKQPHSFVSGGFDTNTATQPDCWQSEAGILPGTQGAALTSRITS